MYIQTCIETHHLASNLLSSIHFILASIVSFQLWNFIFYNVCISTDFMLSFPSHCFFVLAANLNYILNNNEAPGNTFIAGKSAHPCHFCSYILSTSSVSLISFTINVSKAVYTPKLTFFTRWLKETEISRAIHFYFLVSLMP